MPSSFLPLWLLKKSLLEAERELQFVLFSRVGRPNGKMFSLTSWRADKTVKFAKFSDL